MTNSMHTDITAVLDRSGSMQSIKTDTERGFDAFINEQKNVPGRVTVSLVQFDDQHEVVYTAKPLDQVPPLLLRPRGNTALRDALGQAIVATGDRLADMPEEERPGKVIVMILSDGMENASKDWTEEALADLVTHQQANYAWEFVYLGANQDAVHVGTKMGIPADHSLTYAGEYVVNAFMVTSNAVARGRRGDSIRYTARDRDEALGAMATGGTIKEKKRSRQDA